MDEHVRIDAIRVREIALDFRTPFRISEGVLATRRSLIVELVSDGHVGYGEAAPNHEPFYSSETIGTVRTLYDELYLPRLVGRKFETIDAFDAELRRGVRGNPFARAGLENAYWDLVCSRSGVPLVNAIAERLRAAGIPDEAATPAQRIASGVSVGIPEDEKEATLARHVAGYIEDGYQRVKLKIRPGWDTIACRAARSAGGDDLPLWTDANASFRLDEHFDRFQAMDDFGLLFHEQPLHHSDLLEHSRLAKVIQTPICLDESLKDARCGSQAIALDASRIWNIKIQRVGGLLEALAIYRLAFKSGAALWGGTMPESGIGSQVILCLAAFPQFQYAADVEASDRWYQPGLDPVDIPMTADGWITVPQTAGVEAVLDRERYARSSREVLSRQD